MYPCLAVELSLLAALERIEFKNNRDKSLVGKLRRLAAGVPARRAAGRRVRAQAKADGFMAPNRGKGPGRRARRANKKMSMGMRGFPLEMCSARLLACTAQDPFSLIGDVCIPYGASRPSQKVTSLIRVNGNIGTLGIGFVSVSPTFVTDFPCVYYSSAAFTGATVNLTGAGVVSASNPTGYTTAYYDSSGYVMQGRIVNAAMRIRYTGTELNQSGQVYSLYTPDRADMQNFSGTSFGSFRETEIKPFGRDWTTLSSCSQEDREWDYTSPDGVNAIDTYAWNPAASAIPNVGKPVMAFLVSGVPGESFYAEIIIRSESIGPQVQGLTTKNAVDIDGLGKVVSVVNKIPARLAAGAKRAAAVSLAIAEVAADVATVVDVFAGLALAASGAL